MKTEGLPLSVLETLQIIISQLTFLLSLVNNILDIKMIESGQFVAKLESFNPITVLEFIIAIFKPMTHLQGTELVYETIKAADLEEAFHYDHQKIFMT
jgi:signal transduction histidine kinase